MVDYNNIVLEFTISSGSPTIAPNFLMRVDVRSNEQSTSLYFPKSELNPYEAGIVGSGVFRYTLPDPTKLIFLPQNSDIMIHQVHVAKFSQYYCFDDQLLSDGGQYEKMPQSEPCSFATENKYDKFLLIFIIVPLLIG
ncbi:hypothetical protein SNEBB_007354 [Seison nebaliae]|nr:hypothetical protein SNEBB_007354 [Seison nebaliae]